MYGERDGDFLQREIDAMRGSAENILECALTVYSSQELEALGVEGTGCADQAPAAAVGAAANPRGSRQHQGPPRKPPRRSRRRKIGCPTAWFVDAFVTSDEPVEAMKTILPQSVFRPPFPPSSGIRSAPVG